ncbi:MAG: hypothetical protein Q9214_004405, partial [Letrouitia sp. 1 TL-2023]
NFLQNADYRESDPRKIMLAQITASTAKRKQEIARIFAEDGQFISSTAPAPKHPRIAGELLDETEKAMVMRPPTSIPAKRQGWDWTPAEKRDVSGRASLIRPAIVKRVNFASNLLAINWIGHAHTLIGLP